MKLIKKNKQVIITILFLSVIGDIVFMKDSSDIVLFGILIPYIFSVWLLQIKSKITISFTLLLVAIMFIEFVLTGTSEGAEKAVTWFFFFFAIGIVQRLKESV